MNKVLTSLLVFTAISCHTASASSSKTYMKLYECHLLTPSGKIQSRAMFPIEVNEHYYSSGETYVYVNTSKRDIAAFDYFGGDFFYLKVLGNTKRRIHMILTYDKHLEGSVTHKNFSIELDDSSFSEKINPYPGSTDNRLDFKVQCKLY